MNKQELTFALIQAKQEALDWQEKYMNQRVANEKQAEKIVRQAARIAELEELYKLDYSGTVMGRVEYATQRCPNCPLVEEAEEVQE